MMEKQGLELVQHMAPADILPQLSIDCVIFGFHDGQLKILLLRFKNTEAWALPGGFVFQNESIEDAAQRILLDRTGLKDIYLEQFYVFGEKNRNHAASHKGIFGANNIQLADNHWMTVLMHVYGLMWHKNQIWSLTTTTSLRKRSIRCA